MVKNGSADFENIGGGRDILMGAVSQWWLKKYVIRITVGYLPHQHGKLLLGVNVLLKISQKTLQWSLMKYDNDYLYDIQWHP